MSTCIMTCVKFRELYPGINSINKNINILTATHALRIEKYQFLTDIFRVAIKLLRVINRYVIFIFSI